MNKAFRILEIIWLVMGCVGVVMSAYCVSTGDNRGSIYFLVFTLACGMMYAVRRRQRIKFAKKNPNENQMEITK
jgi:uncharacterized membrane protein YfcA